MAYSLTGLLSAIANAIRSKKNISGTINAQDFPSEIESIKFIVPDGMKFQESQNSTLPLLDVSNVTDFYCMFYNCPQLITIPPLNTINGTDFGGMFYDCVSLTTIEELDVTNGTDSMFMFQNCTSLTNINFIGSINMGISFSYCPLNSDSILNVLNACNRTTNNNPKTVTFMRGSTFSDLTGIIPQCVAKGWTIQNLTIS